jgi:hypothetical protein
MNSVIEFFAEYKSIVVIGHAVSAAIGLGAATVSDVLFFKFLEDGNITNKETPVLDVMTKIMWVALTLLILTGVMLFLSDPVGYLESSKFIVKMFIVFIIAINGLLMTTYLHKNMQKLTFTDPYHRKVKRIAFASGAISIASWYLSFFLGSVRSIPFDTTTGLGLLLSFFSAPRGIRTPVD